MADLEWPAGLSPHRVLFYLQPHVGGAESPLTRTRKIYGLSAPRWVARLTFRGGYAGAPGERQAGYGPRLDALIADLEGGLNKIRFHDFRRPRPLQPRRVVAPLTISAAAAGASSFAVAGFAPHSVAFSIGDYVGGDGRPHIVQGGAIRAGVGSIMADSSGVAVVSFRPPLAVGIPGGTPLPALATGRFDLTSEDAGQNETDVGDVTTYALDFVEALS